MTDQALPTYFRMTKQWQWPSTEDAIDSATAGLQAAGHEVEVAVVKVIETLLRDGGAFGFPITTDREASVNWRQRCADDLAWSLRQESGFDESLQPLIARLLLERSIDIRTTELRMNRPGPRFVQLLRHRALEAGHRFAACSSDAVTSHEELVRAQERFEVLGELAVEFGQMSPSEADRLRRDAREFAASDSERDYFQWKARREARRLRLTRLCKRGLDHLTALFRGSRQVQGTGRLTSGTVASDAAAGTESATDDKVRRVAAEAAVVGAGPAEAGPSEVTL